LAGPGAHAIVVTIRTLKTFRLAEVMGVIIRDGVIVAHHVGFTARDL
jgi:hypothetical protein